MGGSMPYDDDPYWGGLSKTRPIHPVKKPQEAENTPMSWRSLDWATDVLARSKKSPRAPNPSPLLIDWVKAQGKVVK